MFSVSFDSLNLNRTDEKLYGKYDPELVACAHLENESEEDIQASLTCRCLLPF